MPSDNIIMNCVCLSTPELNFLVSGIKVFGQSLIFASACCSFC
jgi:hypothetical protein